MGFGFNGAILKTLHTPDNILVGQLYLGIYFGLPFLMYNILAAVFNAMGDSVTPLGFLVFFSSLLNVALDLLFSHLAGNGCGRVAIATVFLGPGLLPRLLFCLSKVVKEGYGGRKRKDLHITI